MAKFIFERIWKLSVQRSKAVSLLSETIEIVESVHVRYGFTDPESRQGLTALDRTRFIIVPNGEHRYFAASNAVTWATISNNDGIDMLFALMVATVAESAAEISGDRHKDSHALHNSCEPCD